MKEICVGEARRYVGEMFRAAAPIAFAFLISTVPVFSKAIDARIVFTKHCWKDNNKDDIPTHADFSFADGGVLLWNGTRADWTTFRSLLNDIPRANGPQGNIYLSIPEDLPHRSEIIAILAKQGITQHTCSKSLFPIEHLGH